MKTQTKFYEFTQNNSGAPDVRIHFLDGTKKEIFKSEVTV
jgi:hypothetical protein